VRVRRRKLALLAVAVGSLWAQGLSAQQTEPGSEKPPLTLTGRIPLANVKGRMDHLGVDVKGQRLFAAAFDNRTLEASRSTRSRTWSIHKAPSTTLPPIACSSHPKVTAR
jgi:hypothetical protein